MCDLMRHKLNKVWMNSLLLLLPVGFKCSAAILYFGGTTGEIIPICRVVNSTLRRILVLFCNRELFFFFFNCEGEFRLFIKMVVVAGYNELLIVLDCYISLCLKTLYCAYQSPPFMLEFQTNKLTNVEAEDIFFKY